MFINNYSLPKVSTPSFLVNFISKQEKTKAVIATLACSIFLLAAISWTCSRFWGSRRVQLKPSNKTSQKNKTKLPKEQSFSEKTQVPLPPQDTSNVKKKTQTPKQQQQTQLSFSNNSVQTQKGSVDTMDADSMDVDSIIDADSMDVDSIDKVKKIDPNAVQSNVSHISICIISCRECGLVGKSVDIPRINQFKLENKDPIPLEENDILLSLHCFNEPQGTKVPPQIYLPANLFANKKEGDILRLYYDNELIEFHLHQTQHQAKFEQGTFEDTIKKAKITHGGNLHGLFEKYDPYADYALNGGTLYNVIPKGTGPLKLQAVSADQFRPLQKTAMMKDKASRTEKKITIIQQVALLILKRPEGIYILMELPGFSEQDASCVQMILNKKILGFHILRGRTTLFKNIKGAVPIQRGPEEFVRTLKWENLFKNCDLKQVQDSAAKASVIFHDGVMQTFFPNP